MQGRRERTGETQSKTLDTSSRSSRKPNGQKLPLATKRGGFTRGCTSRNQTKGYWKYIFSRQHSHEDKEISAELGKVLFRWLKSKVVRLDLIVRVFLYKNSRKRTLEPAMRPRRSDSVGGGGLRG